MYAAGTQGCNKLFTQDPGRPKNDQGLSFGNGSNREQNKNKLQARNTHHRTLYE